tara:strand:- start:501 stop:770 length:270 start_codon:yes stop_codon:yes gene_type:complete
MDKNYQNWTNAYIKSISEKREKQEEALVADHRAIVKQILDKLEDKLGDALVKGDEKSLALVNQIARTVGLGISQKKQAKGRSFSYKLKK